MTKKYVNYLVKYVLDDVSSSTYIEFETLDEAKAYAQGCITKGYAKETYIFTVSHTKKFIRHTTVMSVEVDPRSNEKINTDE